MNNDWNLSPHNIVIRFPPNGGGNLVMNMLSYFNSFSYPLPLTVFYHRGLDIRNFSNNDLKNLSHHLVINTIPPNHLSKFWGVFETRNFQFWGFRFSDLFDPNNIGNDTSNYFAFRKILEQYYCMHKVHLGSYDDIKKIVPNGKIINLIKCDTLQIISKEFKIHHVDHIFRLDEIIGPDCLSIDMSYIFNKNQFFDQISNIAYTISGDNTFDPRMEEYYDKYTAIHLYQEKL